MRIILVKDHRSASGIEYRNGVELGVPYREARRLIEAHAAIPVGLRWILGRKDFTEVEAEEIRALLPLTLLERERLKQRTASRETNEVGEGGR